MFVSNAIKVVGCLMMAFGAHPLLSYAIVGLGAAAYSPAKYGILTELLPPSQLVKANGWIEGLTILSVILGIVLGGQLVGRHVSAVLLGLDLPFIDTGIDTPAEGAIAAIMLLYVVAALFNLYIPRTEAPLQPMPRQPAEPGARLLAVQRAAVERQAGPDLAGHDHAVLGHRRQHARHRLPLGRGGAGLQRHAGLDAGRRWWPSARRWAPSWPRCHAAGQGHRHHPDGHCHGPADRRAEFRQQRLGGGALPDPARRRQRLPGGADERAAAAPRPQPDGCRPLDRRAELQRAGLHPGPERHSTR